MNSVWCSYYTLCVCACTRVHVSVIDDHPPPPIHYHYLICHLFYRGCKQLILAAEYPRTCASACASVRIRISGWEKWPDNILSLLTLGIYFLLLPEELKKNSRVWRLNAIFCALTCNGFLIGTFIRTLIGKSNSNTRPWSRQSHLHVSHVTAVGWRKKMDLSWSQPDCDPQ